MLKMLRMLYKDKESACCLTWRLCEHQRSAPVMKSVSVRVHPYLGADFMDTERTNFAGRIRTGQLQVGTEKHWTQGIVADT